MKLERCDTRTYERATEVESSRQGMRETRESQDHAIWRMLN